MAPHNCLLSRKRAELGLLALADRLQFPVGFFHHRRAFL